MVPGDYPTRYAYNSDAAMVDLVFLYALLSSGNGLVPVHAVTFPYDAATREFEEETHASIHLRTRRGTL